MNAHPGTCHCGKSTFFIKLPERLGSYSPRKCDCSFCMDRGLSWLSHPDGAIEIESETPFKVIKQGSNQALILVCSGCDVVVAVTHRFPDGIKGAVNAGLLPERESLNKENIVSPKHLSPEEKLIRWRSVWCSVNVTH